MAELSTRWYAFLAGLTYRFAEPLYSLAEAAPWPLLGAFLLGLLAMTSPCLLSTNIAALGFVSRSVDRPWLIMGQALSYAAGRVLVYGLIGLLAVGLGLQLDRASVPVIVAVRKAMGPLLVLLGLAMLGKVRLPAPGLDALAAFFERQAEERSGHLSAFLLGIAFSLVACPTLVWLFFGLLVPLALVSTGGLVFPAVFAVGSVMPVLVGAWLVAGGAQDAVSQVRDLRRWRTLAGRVGAGVFLLAGLNEIFIYWV